LRRKKHAFADLQLNGQALKHIPTHSTMRWNQPI